MNLESFVQQRQAAWQRLELIVQQLTSRRASRVPAERVTEMIYLYQQVSADLARLRTSEADAELIAKVNRLVGRAHDQLYRGRKRRSWSLRRFVIVEYPRLFRQSGRFVLASLLLCTLFYAMAFETVQSHPEIVADILGGAEQQFTGTKTPEDITDRFAQARDMLSSPAMSSMITTNNIRVALMAFALGVTFGVGTVYVLIVNSSMVGGIAGAFAASGHQGVLWATLLPHGALELSAIVVSGAAGLMMGWAMWCPGQRTRRRALREQAVRAVLLVMGLIPAFVVAGVIEGFITPSDAISAPTKVTLGVSVALVFWGYLLLGGRRGNGEKLAEPK